MSKRITVGLLIHHLENDYSRALVSGASEAAKDLDVNIVFIPGRSLGGDYYDRKHTVYEYQNNVLYNYVSSEVMDGIIVSAGTIGQFVSREEFKSFIDKYEGMPVLTLENEVRGYPCLRFGSDGIKLIIDHLVNEHGCRNIAFVSGPKNNKDAESRLEKYRESMTEHDLDCDDSLVAYGNFSEYSEEAVNHLIDTCGRKLDAICFANDQMCIGGYKAVRARGLVPGKDIFITGYDDSEVAKSLSPMLTTVRADASVLGYLAVQKAVNWIKTGIAPENEEISSGLVIRNSCGCESISGDGSRLNNIIKEMTPEEAARTIVSIIAGTDISKNGSLMREKLSDFAAGLMTAAAGGGDIPAPKFINEFGALLNEGISGYIGFDLLASVLDTVQRSCISLSGDVHMGLHVRQLKISDLFKKLDRMITDFIIGQFYRDQTDSATCSFLISNIAKDMIMFMTDEEQCFYSIINNMSRIHIRSSFIYTYEKVIMNSPGAQWVNPKNLYLKAYHTGEKLVTPKGDDQIIPTNEYINNVYSEVSKRRTLVLYPLYSNEEQYGLLLCDVEPKYFPYIYSTAPQICTAIMLTGLVKRLEGSLVAVQNTNTMLNKISMYDELTEVYNRRGFYNFANELIRKDKSNGMIGVLLFGDLDNLKKINDTFGHDDGDYAIKTAAGYLKKGLRDSDIVARIGGDEFSALAVVDPENKCLIEKIPMRIKEIAEKHNQTSDKPYNVCMSLGVYTFKCSKDVDIRDYMDKADSALYQDKKNKSREILKNPEGK